MSIRLKCTMANFFKFFLCGFQQKPKAPGLSPPSYWKTCFKFGKMAEKQPKSSEHEVHLFPHFIVNLSEAMSFGLKFTMANLFKFFLRSKELVSAPSYWKTCFKFGKMAERQPKSSECEVHLLQPFMVSLSGAMSFGLTSTMANLFKFFLCGF